MMGSYKRPFHQNHHNRWNAAATAFIQAFSDAPTKSLTLCESFVCWIYNTAAIAVLNTEQCDAATDTFSNSKAPFGSVWSFEVTFLFIYIYTVLTLDFVVLDLSTL